MSMRKRHVALMASNNVGGVVATCVPLLSVQLRDVSVQSRRA